MSPDCLFLWLVLLIIIRIPEHYVVVVVVVGQIATAAIMISRMT